MIPSHTVVTGEHHRTKTVLHVLAISRESQYNHTVASHSHGKSVWRSWGLAFVALLSEILVQATIVGVRGAVPPNYVGVDLQESEDGDFFGAEIIWVGFVDTMSSRGS
ncbi:hypothetical protein HGRIS_000102 [Hohenbuehelia grisea]|uniref:Uncharacterized protein n=1 Tax=Hohenbuehelia grisea TaxID=104357 RepID=A0ABR3JQU4_9AGAR